MIDMPGGPDNMRHANRCSEKFRLFWQKEPRKEIPFAPSERAGLDYRSMGETKEPLIDAWRSPGAFGDAGSMESRIVSGEEVFPVVFTANCKLRPLWGSGVFRVIVPCRCASVLSAWSQKSEISSSPFFIVARSRPSTKDSGGKGKFATLP